MARFDCLKFDGGMGLENLVSDIRQLLNAGIPLITAMWDHQDGRIDSNELASKIIFLTDLLNERLN